MRLGQEVIEFLKTLFVPRSGSSSINGHLFPAADISWNLGKTGKRFDTVYARNVVADYITGEGGDADTVDGFHAYSTKVASSLIALDAGTYFPYNVIQQGHGSLFDADKLDGYATVIVAFGASIKGFGAAGITAETELARTRALIEGARERGITLIGVHIGGAERRDALSMQFPELVAPAVDVLVVWADGNQDGWFTEVAEREGIPLVLLDQPIAVGTALADLFES